ncbi:tripartite tricarboxylate transporter substrate-binding protein [Falsiroseomonas oryzae]|uniref:tripartite tricarboxylate transporter substrate-binding protein n=1 Tax=Falsiroseomonas oryzae TaxID=2766473 RepID=UPI0022EA81D8|nr:tripartite tricarboxylate transporter substrate-binding protein [Roseomonas sp. MO-31]
MFTRRTALGLLAAPLVIRPAAAWPDRPIRLLHGFAPGGTADILARVLATPMADALGQPVVVEPRPGAGGNIASAQLARAPADGNTLGLLTGGHAVSAAFAQGLTFDPLNDFDFVALVVRYAFVVVVRADNPARDLRALLDMARAQPGRVTFGSAGVGSTHHLVGEMLNATAGVQMQHVPYRGDAAGTTALLAGEISAMVTTSVGVLPHVRSGAVRCLAVSSTRRSGLLPEVPTVAEAALPGFDAPTWAGIAGPRGLPEPVALQLHATIARVIAEPAIRRRLDELLDGEVEAGRPGDMRPFVAAEIARWRQVIQRQGIRMEG